MNQNLVTGTVEIFHDAESGRLDPGVVLSGLEVVSAIAGRLDIIRQTRLLKVSLPNADEVQVDKIRWPAFEADINMVLTERPLVLAQQSNGTIVESINAGVAMPFSQVALIDVSSAKFPRMTTAHEIGHLFGLKNVGTWVDGPEAGAHCRRMDCIMHSTRLEQPEIVPVSVKGIRKAMQNLKLTPPQYKVVTTCSNAEFCHECTDQLEKAGQKRALARRGIHLPDFK